MRSALCVAMLALTLAGCGLSPKQAASLDKYEKAVKAAVARVEAYDAEIQDVRKMVKEKKLDPAKAMAIIAKLAGNKEKEMETINTGVAAIKELRSQEVPWWYYIGPAVVGILGIAGGYIPGARKAAGVVQKLDQAGRIIGTMVHGIEAGGHSATKSAVEAEASRAGILPEVHAKVREITYNGKTGKHT